MNNKFVTVFQFDLIEWKKGQFIQPILKIFDDPKIIDSLIYYKQQYAKS